MSAEVERVFSSAKRTLTVERSRLGTDLLEATEYLRHWRNSGFKHTEAGFLPYVLSKHILKNIDHSYPARASVAHSPGGITLGRVEGEPGADFTLLGKETHDL
jgi:hypothetical protein